VSWELLLFPAPQRVSASVPVRPQARAGWRFSFLNEASRDFRQLVRDSQFEKKCWIWIHLDPFGFHLSMNFTSAYRNRPLARKPKRCAACHSVRSPPAITAADWSSESGPALVLCRDDSQPHGCNLLHEVSLKGITTNPSISIISWILVGIGWRHDQGRSDGGASSQTCSDIGSIMLYRSLFCQLDQWDMKYPHVSTSVRTEAIRFFPIRKEVRQSGHSWALAELICQLFFHILCMFVLSFLPLCPPFRYFCFAYAMFTDQSGLSRLRRRQGSQGNPNLVPVSLKKCCY